MKNNSDIEIAKKYLIEENLTMAIVKNRRVILKSTERGIKPLFMAIMDKKDAIKGGSLADKVIGKAAAMLCAKGGIYQIYTRTISQGAVDILEAKSISYNYDNKVDYILNRTKSGLCPVENLSKDQADVDILIKDIESFLKSIGQY